MEKRRGRPCRVPNDPATRVLKVLMTDAEYCRLKAAGQIENKSISDVVRDQLMKYYDGYTGSKRDELNSLTCRFYEEDL